MAKRGQRRLALAGMLVGFTFGLIRFGISRATKDCTTKQAGAIECMNFNHVGLLIFCISTTVAVLASLCTDRPAVEQLDGACITFATPKSRRDVALQQSTANLLQL